MDLLKMCRLCFLEKTNLHSLQHNCPISNIRLSIKECVNIEFSEEVEDSMPNKICNDCVVKITNWIRFRDDCRRANARFLQYLLQAQNAEEFINGQTPFEKRCKSNECDSFQNSSGKENIATVKTVSAEVAAHMSIATLCPSSITESCPINCAPTWRSLSHEVSETKVADEKVASGVAVVNRNKSSLTKAKSRLKGDTDISGDGGGDGDGSRCNSNVGIKSTMKRYACQLCAEFFSRFCDLLEHDETVHESVARNWVCKSCGKLFVSEDRIRVHEARYHGEKPFTCAICCKQFLNKCTLRKHLVIHSKSFVCGYCQLSTCSASSLAEHVRVHTGDKRFVCDECGRRYVSRHTLNVHKKSTHSAVTAAAAAKEKQFMCDICGYTARSRSSVYIHRDTHTNVKPFVCERCGDAFKSKIRLNEHRRRRHSTASKRFVCETCKMAFSQNYQLVKHRRVHSGEKPFWCDVCGRRFARADGLSEHRRTHTGEKRYTCQRCLAAFSFLKTFKTHKCGGALVSENLRNVT